MSFVLTFVAVQHYSSFEKSCQDAVDGCGLTILDKIILSPNKALDIVITHCPINHIDHLRTTLKCDVFLQKHSPDTRRKKLLLSDMDATIVAEETLDELAAALGLKDKIAAITAATMRGELDFEASVTKRVAMLTGLPLSDMQKTASHLNYSCGAFTLVNTMNTHNCHTILVSGGFTYFTNHVAEHVGFKENFGNQLGVKNNKLDGTVATPILGKAYKASLLQQKAAEYSLTLQQTCCVGDGANDLDMLKTAADHDGLGMGFHPKPLLKQSLDNSIIYGDLTCLLYAQGYKENEIIHN